MNREMAVGNFGSGRAIGIACAIGAVALGMAHLALAGAPVRDAAVNGVALAIGLLLFAATRTRTSPSAIAIAAVAAALVATALAGTRVDGVARWVRFGPLLIQPSFVLLPAMVVASARERSRLAAAAMVIAAAALALQPDRGMAGALALAVTVLAIMRPERATGLVAAAALAAFAVTLARADPLPPEPFVEGVIASSFAAGIVAGLAAAGGLMLLLAPAVARWWREPDARAAYGAFGAMWLGLVAASALGDYPTPVVGYGGSAIVGYVLSLAALPRRDRDRARRNGWGAPTATSTSPDRHPLAIA